MTSLAVIRKLVVTSAGYGLRGGLSPSRWRFMVRR